MKRIFLTILALFFSVITFGQCMIGSTEEDVRFKYETYSNVIFEKKKQDPVDANKYTLTYMMNDNEKRVYSFITSVSGNMCYQYLIQNPNYKDFSVVKEELGKMYKFVEKEKNSDYIKNSKVVANSWKYGYAYIQEVPNYGFNFKWILYDCVTSYIVIVNVENKNNK